MLNAEEYILNLSKRYNSIILDRLLVQMYNIKEHVIMLKIL